MQTYLEQHDWVVNYRDTVLVRYISTPWEDARASHPLGLLLYCSAGVICNVDGGKRKAAGYDHYNLLYYRIVLLIR
jgi:hypothetical protein